MARLVANAAQAEENTKSSRRWGPSNLQWSAGQTPLPKGFFPPLYYLYGGTLNLLPIEPLEPASGLTTSYACPAHNKHTYLGTKYT
jgi:hypothetical protein